MTLLACIFLVLCLLFAIEGNDLISFICFAIAVIMALVVMWIPIAPVKTYTDRGLCLQLYYFVSLINSEEVNLHQVVDKQLCDGIISEDNHNVLIEYVYQHFTDELGFNLFPDSAIRSRREHIQALLEEQVDRYGVFSL